MYAGPGMLWMDGNIAKGVQERRRNPKRKSRLPYHAKKLLSLSVVQTSSSCRHSLSLHQETKAGDVYSAALECTVNHKATTKSPQHKDTTGRKWK